MTNTKSMDQTLLAELQKKAEAIAKETATRLAQFHKSVAELLYSSTDGGNATPENRHMPDDTARNIAEKSQRYLEQAAEKAHFAPEDKWKQARAMEQIVQEGNERIRRLYEDAIRSQQNTAS